MIFSLALRIFDIYIYICMYIYNTINSNSPLLKLPPIKVNALLLTPDI